jgi:hypothetical protein
MGQFLGWVELNLVAWIEHTILRAAIRSPRAWTPAIAMPTIKHRIGWSHPASRIRRPTAVSRARRIYNGEGNPDCQCA